MIHFLSFSRELRPLHLLALRLRLPDDQWRTWKSAGECRKMSRMNTYLDILDIDVTGVEYCYMLLPTYILGCIAKYTPSLIWLSYTIYNESRSNSQQEAAMDFHDHNWGHCHSHIDWGDEHQCELQNDVKDSHIPSGKRLHNYGKSQFLMGKLTINGHFQ
jgi:hypothetical protein